MESVGEAKSMSSKTYSRAEMEVLRFANTAEQSALWNTIYEGLNDVVRKDYDDLATSKRIRNRPTKKEQYREDCSQAQGRETDGISNDDYEHQALEGDDLDDDDDDDDDESDEEFSIQRPAFLVEGEPNFDSGPPEDGLEYLRRVRWEAAKIPKVKVAKFDKSKLNKEQSDYMPKIPEISKCPKHLMPSKQWEDAFLAEFSQLRLGLSRLENFSSKSTRELLSSTILAEESCISRGLILEGSEKLETDAHSSDLPNFSGSEIENDQLSAGEDDSTSLPSEKSVPKSSVNEDCNHYPLLSVISKMDSVARVSTLKKRISSMQDMNILQKIDCLWLFALSAVVDTPLDADTCASLRSLLRKCSGLLAKKSELDDEVAMLNILTTISGKYFGQLET